MWKFNLKNKMDVKTNKGDTIKNSAITIQQHQDSSMIKEIYYKIGGVERDIKNIYYRISELKQDIKSIKDESSEYDSPFPKRRIH